MRITGVTTAALLAGALIVGKTTHATTGGDDPVVSDVVANMNDQLRAAGVQHLVVSRVELLLAPGGKPDQATTLIANDRTHLTTAQFVENDPRRGSPPNTLTYVVDQSDGSALSWVTVPGGAIVALPNAVTELELDASMDVWAARKCNGPLLEKVPDPGTDPDIADAILLNNAALFGTPVADITHAGWVGGALFNAIAPQGSTFILAATFTFVFADALGNPTDIDGDGRADAGIREIFYNRGIPWGTGGNDSNVDIQSVAIHEVGHALGLAHFGKIFVKENGALQFAPKAIMNAAYVAEDRTIRGTDNAAFCQAWARSH